MSPLIRVRRLSAVLGILAVLHLLLCATGPHGHLPVAHAAMALDGHDDGAHAQACDSLGVTPAAQAVPAGGAVSQEPAEQRPVHSRRLSPGPRPAGITLLTAMCISRV